MNSVGNIAYKHRVEQLEAELRDLSAKRAIEAKESDSLREQLEEARKEAEEWKQGAQERHRLWFEALAEREKPREALRASLDAIDTHDGRMCQAYHDGDQPAVPPRTYCPLCKVTPAIRAALLPSTPEQSKGDG